MLVFIILDQIPISNNYILTILTNTKIKDKFSNTSKKHVSVDNGPPALPSRGGPLPGGGGAGGGAALHRCPLAGYKVGG